MEPLQATRLLDLWEHARRLDPVPRAVALAAAASPTAAPHEVETLPLGRRDARLLGLRDPRATTLDATAVCPLCDERVEFAPETARLLAAEPAAVEPLAAHEHVVQWRLPDSRDASAAAMATDGADARATLLACCVTSATGPSGTIAPHELPDEMVVALEDAIADSDPLTEVRITLDCPACATAFVADLDLADFVWADIDVRARCLLRDVDVLARAYGWNEPEVLALGDERRAAYIELALAGGS